MSSSLKISVIICGLAGLLVLLFCIGEAESITGSQYTQFTPYKLSFFFFLKEKGEVDQSAEKNQSNI